MTVTKGPLGSPIPVGKTFPVLSDAPIASGSASRMFGVDADGILVSVFVPNVTGSVDVIVDTLGEDGSERNVITFPSITSPTAELVFRTAVNILSRIRVTVNYTGSCEYQIRARGISRGGAAADDAPITVDLSPLTVTNPSISNVTLSLANTEQAIVLPAGVKRYSLKARNDARLQLSYISGESNVEFWTIWAGNVETEDVIDKDSLTLYIQANKDSTILEIKSWT